MQVVYLELADLQVRAAHGAFDLGWQPLVHLLADVGQDIRVLSHVLGRDRTRHALQCGLLYLAQVIVQHEVPSGILAVLVLGADVLVERRYHVWGGIHLKRHGGLELHLIAVGVGGSYDAGVRTTSISGDVRTLVGGQLIYAIRNSNRTYGLSWSYDVIEGLALDGTAGIMKPNLLDAC